MLHWTLTISAARKHGKMLSADRDTIRADLAEVRSEHPHDHSRDLLTSKQGARTACSTILATLMAHTQLVFVFGALYLLA